MSAGMVNPWTAGGGVDQSSVGITGGTSKWDDGANTTPSIAWADDTTTGLFSRVNGYTMFSVAGVESGYFGSVGGTSAAYLAVRSGIAIVNGNTDGAGAISYLTYSGTNAVNFSAGGTTQTARTELNKSVTAIADNVATAVLTITIPNAAHSGSVRVRVTGSAGAGGSIGANEATATNEYIVTVTRTAGVNAVAGISSAYGGSTATVAGGNAVTVTAAVSAVSGAVGATNTFTVNVTIARAAGTATNHTCLVYAQLMNANATGITIS